MKILLNLFFVNILVVTCYAQKIDLTLNLEKGKEYKQITNSKITKNQKSYGKDTSMITYIKDEIIYKVVSVNIADYNLEAKYENLSMTFDLLQDTIINSSEINEVQDFFSTLLSEMTGYVFNVKMSKKGKIIEVKNIDSKIDSIFTNSTHIQETKLVQQKAQMNEMFSAEAFKSNKEMVIAFFPDKPVSKGDKWTIESNLETSTTGEITTEYEFTEFGSDYILITGKSTVKTADIDRYIELNGMFVKYDISGSMISELKIDRKTGWIIEGRIYQDIKGDAYFKLDEQMSNGIKIPMNMKIETGITNN